jgi:phosphate transport system substrate-binding protein
MVTVTARRLAAPTLALLLAQAPGAAGAAEVLRLSGSGSALGPMRRLAQAFEAANPGLEIKVLPSVGSSGAIRAVAAGALDLGLSGRALGPDEAAQGVTGVEVARTPFLFVAGPRAAATHLDAAALARILRGEQTSWPSGERIRLVLRPAADADTLYLRSLSPALREAMDVALARPGMMMAVTNQECDAMLARTPGALGPSTLAQLTTEAPGLTPLAWEGEAPTLDGLASGRYRLSKPIVLLLPARPAPAATRFLAFVRSPEGRRILSAAGCLPTAAPAGG